MYRVNVITLDISPDARICNQLFDKLEKAKLYMEKDSSGADKVGKHEIIVCSEYKDDSLIPHSFKKIKYIKVNGNVLDA